MKTKTKKVLVKSKTAYVLGGLGLLGKEISDQLLRERIKVIILDIKEKPKKARHGVKYEKFDLTNLDEIENNINKVIKNNGCPDIFINASYPRTLDWKNSSFKKLKLKSLMENVNIHMNSSAWVSILVANLMKKKNKKGSIIFLNSIYGILGQDLNIYKGTNMEPNPIYSLIKGGLNTFSKNMASYYGQYGIRINTIISGGIEGHIAGSKKKQSSRFKNNYSKKTFLKRLAKPQEIARGVVFLSLDKSSYITGSNLVIDAGWSAT